MNWLIQQIGKWTGREGIASKMNSIKRDRPTGKGKRIIQVKVEWLAKIRGVPRLRDPSYKPENRRRTKKTKPSRKLWETVNRTLNSKKVQEGGGINGVQSRGNLAW